MRKRIFTSWLGIAVTTGWAVLMGVFLLEGSIRLFISPTSFWIIVVEIVGIALLLAYEFHHEESYALSGVGVLGVLLVSLLFVQPTSLSYVTADLRAAEQVALSSVPSFERARLEKSTSEFTLLEWLAALEDPTERVRYAGRPVQLSGFLWYQDGQPMLARMLITCCGADARPVAMPLGEGGPWPAEGTWIDVTGKLQLTPDGYRIQASTVDEIPEPRLPYAE